MSIPSVLLSGVRNESQDLQITTDVLEPNVLNSVQAVFVIPKKASVLDSKSALKVRVDWSAQAGGTATDVGGKMFSGILGLIKTARLYASGQLISRLDNAGEYIHLKNQFKSQEYKEEYCDIKHGSESGFLVAEDSAQSGVNGAIQTTDSFDVRTAGTNNVVCNNKPYFRGIGTDADNNGMEMFLLLEELFPMLKDIQLPVRFLKDEIRIEIDWEQDKSKWLYTGGTALANYNDVVVREAVMFLDYITYNPEIDASLEATLTNTGVSIPFRQTAVITKVLAGGSAVAQTNVSEDVLLGQEGRAVMKMYVSKHYPSNIANGGAIYNNAGGENFAYTLQGNCRSDALLNEKFNFVVNDLLLYDRNVENRKEAYNYLCYAGETAYSTYPTAWDANPSFGLAPAPTTDVLYNSNSANDADQLVLSHAPLAPARNATQSKGIVQNGIMGTQNYISADLSKYGSQLNPANAMRIGATPVILRLIRDTTANNQNVNTIASSPVSLTIYVEYLRLFDLRAGDLGVRDL